MKQQPEAVEAILRNTFVDDWLQSCDSEDEMVRLALEVRKIHKEGGFEMRGWISNSNTVMRALSGEGDHQERAIEMTDSTRRERVLGMWWDPRTDYFTFINKFQDDIYDEKKTAKIILQDVWRSAVGWDETVGENERQRWSLWARQLQNIEELKVPRYLDYFHRKFQHQLTEIVVNEMRQLYHISGLRARARAIAKTCQKCRNKRTLPEAP
ncbi:uncharacterized protein LOC111081455 [Drosophila obscura]|uniref:uncharacterized protein LOC111081455 n=1 Tax=Drosophila obscura TaxID=7282 RepID=UPI001BB0ED52|nr:uncharacterized protein LOC111081455 [Drosophila obscura]